MRIIAVSMRLLALLALAGCATAPVEKAHRNDDSPLERLLRHSIEDHRRHYDARSMLGLLAPLAVAGTLANTNADARLDEAWGDSRSGASDDVAHGFLRVGDLAQNRWSLPIYTLTMLAADYSGEVENDSRAATWAERSLRANVLGGPQAWAFTYILGSHRPDAGSSAWNPWNDNDGVSGHSFFGAVPFLTAARMSGSAGWRWTLYMMSALPAYSRLNNGNHYTSQAVMGWSLAWLATGTVAEKRKGNGMTVMPLLAPDGGYVMVSVEF